MRSWKDLSPIALFSGESFEGLILKELTLVGLFGEARDDLGSRVVHVPFDSSLGKGIVTFLTDNPSIRMAFKKLKRRSAETLDYFLFLR